MKRYKSSLWSFKFLIQAKSHEASKLCLTCKVQVSNFPSHKVPKGRPSGGLRVAKVRGTEKAVLSSCRIQRLLDAVTAGITFGSLTYWTTSGCKMVRTGRDMAGVRRERNIE